MYKRQVLIVEDEAIVSMSLQYLLETLGYNVPAVIESGEEAVEAVRQIRPDLVLMDIGLSGELDGIECAARIRRRSRVPVVYLTARADQATVDRAKRTRPRGYLLKPVDPEILKSVIDVAIYKRYSSGPQI